MPGFPSSNLISTFLPQRTFSFKTSGIGSAGCLTRPTVNVLDAFTGLYRFFDLNIIHTKFNKKEKTLNENRTTDFQVFQLKRYDAVLSKTTTLTLGMKKTDFVKKN